VSVGYEDCNVVIETLEAKYVAKIFSKGRKPGDIVRYVVMIEKAITAGVNHPPLIKTSNSKTIYTDDQVDGVSMVLMRFIEGKTFFELDRAPNNHEQRAVLEQASIVNGIDYHPAYLFDSWAIPNIHTMFERVRTFIKPEDLKLVEWAMGQYATIPMDDLPHCFVHGDFTKANVLKGDDGKIYILDFSVANWYPRIQELAVIIANLCYDKNDISSLREKTDLVSENYSTFNELTEKEKQYLYPYVIAGVAMEFMGAHQEKYIKGNDTEETDYWLNLGRDGLKKALA
jgi:Ser/Thr protein kinase RdoA (MazF antagonist)